MAIDTAEKRRSISGIRFISVLAGVTNNVAKDQEWRQQAGWSYSGTLAAGPPSPPPPTAGGSYNVASISVVPVRSGMRH